VKWAKVAWKPSTYDITQKKSAPPNQIIYFIGNYKSCRVFGFGCSNSKFLGLRLHSSGTEQVSRKDSTAFRPSTRHKSAHDHQRTFTIMITVTATSHSIPLIVGMIITDTQAQHWAYHVAYNAQGTPFHHGFSLLISVECACVKHYPWLCCTT